ncbi:MAG: hypothetical protein GXP27_11185 [Planctomycetes bacterium]|nr:hypothetical protein [Planctomycetota bacterium]
MKVQASRIDLSSSQWKTALGSAIWVLVVCFSVESVGEDRGWLDIRNFGATPSDNTDDALSIQKAIDEARRRGVGVFVPKGTFLIGSTLLLPSHVRIRGCGDLSVIKLCDGANTNMFENADPERGNEGIEITRLKLDGNRGKQDLGRVLEINYFVIRTKRAFRCRFQDLTIVNAPGDGIANWGGQYNLYSRITVVSAYRYGIQLQGAKGFGPVRANTVQQCAAYDCGWDGITLGHASDNEIIECNAYRNGHAGIAGDRANGVRVASCLVYENKFYGIAVADAALRTPPHGWIVQSNRVFRNREGGIGVLNGAYDVAVLDNSIANNDGEGIRIGQDCHAVLVRGNRISRNGRDGIRVLGAMAVQITNNICWNNGRSRRGAGIACLGSPRKPVRMVVITGNICFDNQRVPTQQQGIRAIKDEQIIIQNNVCPTPAHAGAPSPERASH